MSIFKRQDNIHDQYNNLDWRTRYRLHREAKARKKMTNVKDNPLHKLVASGDYCFHSDYYEYGNRFGRFLTLIPTDSTDRALTPFWRILLFPRPYILNDDKLEAGDDPDAVFGAHGQLIESMENRTKSWTTKWQNKADGAAKIEDGQNLSAQQQAHVSTRAFDNAVIANDLANGDMYAATEYKVLITANSLKDLDTACARYARNIQTLFDGLHFEVYEGQQYQDFSNMLESATQQVGDHPMATSTEQAGGYDILTRGINDQNGDYLGEMVGDVNNTAVLIDSDNYDGHVVLANSSDASMAKNSSAEFDVGTRSTTLLGTKLAQSALVNNHRVIHFVLNGSKPQNIGADLSDITTVVTLNGQSAGAINPFEIFGDDLNNQYQYFPPHAQKLKLMMQQITPSTDDVDKNDVFTSILQRFYQDQNMLVDNPKENSDALRLVGLPHQEYPLLSKFVAYLDQALSNAEYRHNQNKTNRIEKVKSAFSLMATENVDLFDVETSDSVDSANNSPQVVYDFSDLHKRGKGIAMAQFINALRYATDKLEERDVIILHGADLLDDNVKPYVKSVFKELTQKNVRIVYLYDSPRACLQDFAFNDLTFADYAMLGGMNKELFDLYAKTQHLNLPNALRETAVDYMSGGSNYSKSVYYLRRGIDNVLFALDTNLGSRNGGFLSENPKGFQKSSLGK